MKDIVMHLVETLHHTYDWIGGVGTTLHNQAARQVQRAQASISHTYQEIRQGYQNAGHYVNQSYQNAGHYFNQSYHNTTEKIVTFIYDNKDKILFAGCCIATAYFSPTLFFSAAVVTIIVRVELSRRLRQMADFYLKDEKNPYKLNSRYDNCMNPLELAMGSIAAVDALALGTIYIAGSLVVATLPVLGGIAAGSCAAKLAMNLVYS
jgi:hypothetical protein